MEAKTYTAGETTYRLLGPVFGVLEHVAGTLAELDCDDVEEVFDHLGERVPAFLAGLLCPEGEHPADRDLEAIARDVRWSMDGTQHLEVLRDFFASCGPDQILAHGTVVNELAGMVVARNRSRRGEMPQPASDETSPCSAAETSPGASSSSGDTATPKPGSSSTSRSGE